MHLSNSFKEYRERTMLHKWSQSNRITFLVATILAVGLISGFASCSRRGNHAASGLASDAAQKVYVAPGKLDEFYAFLSGGFSGQLAVYGLPSGRLMKVLPVFSVNPENGYGFNEETKPMLETSHGFVPWDDLHHVELSMKEGVPDGRWIFVNSNNTPRIARLDLSTFRTVEILEIPHSGGNHGSPFATFNNEYVVASTRFSVPIPQRDLPINTRKEKFKGSITFVSVDPDSGKMNVGFQLLVPGIDYDLGHCGKGPSKDWCFFTSYNTEQAHELIEINASKNDKDFIAAINWKLAEECVKEGKAKTMPAQYRRNTLDEHSMVARSEKLTKVKALTPEACPGMIYYIPSAKSPHGSDVDPTGEYFVAGGKLAAQITAYSFSKMLKAIEGKKFTGEFEGIPVLNYPEVMAGEVQKPCLGPLHTEFDGKGNAYTSCFISSEVVKWKMGSWEVVDRIPTYYSLGHLMIPGGDSAKPYGKYLVAMNKITKDRYLPVGPELPQATQLIDISGDKMQLLLDFPSVGEPHYAQGIPASVLMEKSRKLHKIEENHHPQVVRSESDTKVVRNGKDVHIYMTAIRSHLTPDNVEGVKVGDTVYFHVTNLEQDWDIAHGFAIFGGQNAELLLMPGETATLKFVPKAPGIYPYYCTDFCSALHQEMQGYLRVSEAGANVPLKWKSTERKQSAAGDAAKSVPPVEMKMSESKGVGTVKSVVLGPISDPMAAKGKKIFDMKCSACHKFEERFVGPALQGLTFRRQPEWIMNMIMNPAGMTAEDPVAKELLAEYLVQMADQNVTEEESKQLLEYFRSMDKPRN
jgi:nitrous-oxide reductase